MPTPPDEAARLRIVAELGGRRTVTLGEGCTADDAALAALARCTILGDPPAARDLRLRTFTDAATPGPGDLDWNFDTVLSARTPVLTAQDGVDVSTEALRARFAPSGRIPLLVSTLQQDTAQIGLTGNVGDNFGLHAVRAMTDLAVDPYGLWVERDQPMMLSIGSFIQHARDRALVWGTGAVADTPAREKPSPTTSVYLGVRGPRTREHILRRFGLTPPVILDPGLLIRDMHPLPRRKPEHAVGFIIHNLDVPLFDANWSGFKVRNRATPQILVEDIALCERIVTTSLHGLIFCHALGVKAALVAVGDRIPGEEYKFRDYHQSVGDYGFDSRTDLRHTPAMGEADWIALAEAAWCPPAIDLSALRASFPFKREGVA